MPGAGGIAIWAGEKLGSAIASQGIELAFSYLGLGATSTDAKALAEINSKLDTITSQLDEVNQHLIDITTGIQSIEEQLDISTKEVLATITSLDLRNYYGDIDNWYGSKALDAGALAFLGVRRGASPSVWQSHLHSATSFATKLDDVWSAIEGIATVLTRSAAENDATLVRWATYLISQMVPQGTAVDFEPFAQLLQSWFVEAVAEQFKGFVLVKLCIGHDDDAQSDARARMAAKMTLQCDLYRSCVERMALSVLRPAPSGPMLGSERLPRIPSGCESSLLRADILCRCFVTALAVPSNSYLGNRMSGIYGRVLYRPSDVQGPQPPAAPHTCQQNTGATDLTSYHGTNSIMEASFSPVSEFQCVDWYQPLGVYQVASPQKSGMRFARYYWDIPILNHYVEAYTPPGGNGIRQSFLQSCRRDATVSLYDLGELRPLKINPDGSCDLGDTNPGTARFALVISWLDLWSHAGMGLVESFDNAPFDHIKPAEPWLIGERKYLGDHYENNANIYISANSRETLQRLLLMSWDATQRLNVLTCGNSNRPPARGASLPVYREMTEFTLSWDGGHFAEMQYGGSIESVGAFLFTTAADEHGHILLCLQGSIQLNRTEAAGGVFMKTSVALLLKAQPNAAFGESLAPASYSKLFDSSDKIDFTGKQSTASQKIDLLVDYATIALQPGSTYSIIPQYTVHASPDYDHSPFGTTNRFSARGGKVVDQLKITLTDAGIVRPVSSGYRKIG